MSGGDLDLAVVGSLAAGAEAELQGRVHSMLQNLFKDSLEDSAEDQSLAVCRCVSPLCVCVSLSLSLFLPCVVFTNVWHPLDAPAHAHTLLCVVRVT